VKNNLKFFLAGVGVILIDQASKYFAYSIGFGSFLSSLRPLLAFQIFPNYNFAFSLRLPHFLIYVIYAALLAALLFWFWKQRNKSPHLKLGMALVIAGALSNIFDRLALGYVRDFIYIFWGNIFNFADVFILIGIILLLV
jgi:signal peptidase II